MTKREAVLVLGVVVLGLVPAYAVYEYATVHPLIPVTVEVPNTQVAAVGAETVVSYQSQPVKEEDGVCVHSYYAVFTLTMQRDGTFSLMKRCESVRDEAVVWHGEEVRSASSSPMERVFRVTQKGTETLTEALSMTLEARGEELFVVRSTLDEIASTTRFARIPAPGAVKGSSD